MTEAGRGLRCLLAIAALALALPHAASAQESCRDELVPSSELGGDGSGVGGTGLEGEGSGVGGTGLEGEGSGVGGTGLRGEGSGVGGSGLAAGDRIGLAGTRLEGDGSGIGGTGLHVFGTITALDGLCVNGMRIAYEATVPVAIDGRSADVDALAVGQVAWVEARRRQDGLHAERIDVVRALVGRIDSAAAGDDHLMVLGRRVELLDATRVEGERTQLLRAGQRVAVSGLWRDADRVVATRIVAAPEATSRVGPRLADLVARALADERISVEGYLTARDDTAVRLGELRIDSGAAQIARELAPGARVRALGRITPDRVLLIEPPEPPALTLPPELERPVMPRIERPQPIDRPVAPERPPIPEPPVPVLPEPPVIPEAPTDVRQQLDRVR